MPCFVIATGVESKAFPCARDCFVAVLLTRAGTCITDVLNGDGGLTDGWVRDRLINETRKRSFLRWFAALRIERMVNQQDLTGF